MSENLQSAFYTSAFPNYFSANKKKFYILYIFIF